MISSKNPLQIGTIKGIFAGIGSLAIGFIIQEKVTNFIYLFYTLILGFSSYGLSVFFYIIAQRFLGETKVGAYYSINPFIGSLLSFIIFQTIPFYTFYIAFTLMVIGLIFVSIRPKKKIDLDIITNE